MGLLPHATPYRYTVNKLWWFRSPPCNIASKEKPHPATCAVAVERCAVASPAVRPHLCPSCLGIENDNDPFFNHDFFQPNNSIMKKNNTGFSKPALTGLRPMVIALFVAFVAHAVSLGAQTLTFPLNNGFSATVSGVGPTICQPSSAFSFAVPPGPFFILNSGTINQWSSQWNNNEGSYHVATAGVTKQIVVEIPVAGGLGVNTGLTYNFGLFDGTSTSPYGSTGVFNPDNNTNRNAATNSRCFPTAQRCVLAEDSKRPQRLSYPKAGG